MRREFFSKVNGQHLFSVFYSIKKHKKNEYRKHNHTQTELGFILSGKGEYVLGKKQFWVEKGNLIIVRSNEQHCIPNVESENLVAINIQFSPYFFWNECPNYISYAKIKALVNQEIEIDNIQSDKEVGNLFKSLIELLSGNDNNFLITRKVLEIICQISDKIDYKEEFKPDTKHLDNVQKAIEFIKENYYKDITLIDIAKSAAMSRSYFSASFKTDTGLSPYNFLLITRIEKAQELLKNTDKTVMEIAGLCGFTSLTSFNKAFKTLTGITPTDYKNK